jgi:hypothetical protein
MPAGKPLKFTLEDLRAKVNTYFDKCDNDKKPYSITGLALELETTRETLLDYENGNHFSYVDVDQLTPEEKVQYTEEQLKDFQEKKELNERYSDTIKRAKLRCQNWVEEQALIGKANPTFSIFNLKNNYGWKDKNETDLNHSGGLTVEVTKYNQ